MRKVVKSAVFKQWCMELFNEPDKYQFPKKASLDTEYYTAKRAGRKFTKQFDILQEEMKSNEIEHKYCELCGQRLVAIGTSRKNGTLRHSDWEGRTRHKKCFKADGKYGFYRTLRFSTVTGELINY